MEIEDILDKAKDDVNAFLDQYPSGVVVIRGSTATGKSKLSVLLSDFFKTEIISADSRQIYRYMDIWTDKITPEIREKIVHHQIDIVDPDILYTAWEWKEDVENLIPQINSRWNIPFIVGWTGLYIDTIYRNFTLPKVEPDFEYRDSLNKLEDENPGTLHSMLQKVDPDEAMKIHPNANRYLVRALEIFEKTWKPKSELATELPVKFPLLMLWLWREKEQANAKINKRIKEMFDFWLVDEVKWLLDRWYDPNLQSMQWIGYKEIVGYIKWEYDKNAAEELLKRNTHHYAKRQRTWFRRYIAQSIQMPKENVVYKLYDLS